MKHSRIPLLLPAIVALFCALAPLFAQTAAPAGATQHPSSTPYTGDLSVFDYPDRAQKLHIDQVMDLLGIAPGKSVADLGAGSGWFTLLAAQRVTGSGKVYAIDINPEAIAYIQKRVATDKLQNVTTILSTPEDPRLPPQSVDAVLLLKVYHEVAKPIDLMRNLRPALRPGARIGIIERNGNAGNHGISKPVLLQEMETAGYRLVSEHDDLVKADRVDFFFIFEAR